MSEVEQLDYVCRYLMTWKDRLLSLEDLYMAILWPKAVDKPNGYVLFRRGTTAYDQNKGLDIDGSGEITKFEAAAKVWKKYYRGQRYDA
jgi:hypothetical protein